MKQIIILVFACMTLLACNNHPGSSGSILVDITSPQEQIIDSESIMSLSHINEHMYDRHEFRIASLSDYEYNKTVSFVVPNRPQLLSNPTNRMEEIRRTIWLINHELHGLYANNTERNSSTLYDGIIREANAISKSDAQYKYLVVLSDLAVNDETYSIYKDQALLVHHPDSVMIRLKRNITCNDLSGMHVFFIFQPKNMQENKNFVLMSNLFKEELESHHALVIIGSNIVNP